MKHTATISKAIKKQDKIPVAAYIWSLRVPTDPLRSDVVYKVVRCGKLLVTSVCIYYKCNFLLSWTVDSGFLSDNKSLPRYMMQITEQRCSCIDFSIRSGTARSEHRNSQAHITHTAHCFVRNSVLARTEIIIILFNRTQSTVKIKASANYN